MLIEKTLFDNIDKVKKSIERLKIYEPKDGYYLAFSGGKDSVVIKSLADMAEVKYDAHYNYVGIDPPELVKFIKEYHKDVIFEKPVENFFPALVRKGFPLRQARWCCELLKEKAGDTYGRRVVTGVRWAESTKRALRKTVETCYKDKTKKYINPIIEWTDLDVWEFIKKHKIPYCKLYDDGWTRIGCLFCPMASKRRLVEVKKYPKFKNAFIINFQKLYDKRKSEGKKSVDRWKSGKEMFEWWINENKEKEIPDQSVMFE